MAEKKITRVERMTDIILLLKGESAVNATTTEEAVAFMQKEIEATKKKNSGKSRKKSEAAEVQNKAYTRMILEVLYNEVSEDGLTCGEIFRKIPQMFADGCGSQKVAYLIGKRPGMLSDIGYVESKKVKGENRYFLTGAGLSYYDSLSDDNSEEEEDDA